VSGTNKITESMTTGNNKNINLSPWKPGQLATLVVGPKELET